jgi:type IV pilus assembly protein PilW
MMVSLKFKRLPVSAGFTLVELLVGLVLGLLIAAIMGTMYLSSKVSFSTSIQVARAQESVRFASLFIQRDMRQASFTDCGSSSGLSNHLLTSAADYFVEPSNSGIMGWESDGTEYGDTKVIDYVNVSLDSTAAEVTSARTANAGAAAEWENNAGAALPTVIANLSPIAGSDVVMIASERKTDIILSDVGASPFGTDLAVDFGAGGVKQGNVVTVGDCRIQDKFQNNSTDPDIITTSQGAVGAFSPGNNLAWSSDAGNPWSKAWNSEAAVYVEEISVYYVGTGASGQPSLFRYTSRCGLTPLSAGCANSYNDELVEGIENIQVFYGEDLDNDDVANIYRSASSVVDFSQVVSVRFGILTRSANTSDLQSADTFDLLDGVVIDPPNLRVLRYVNNMTVHLRNRGL